MSFVENRTVWMEGQGGKGSSSSPRAGARKEYGFRTTWWRMGGLSSTCTPSLCPGSKPKQQIEDSCIWKVSRTKLCITKVFVRNIAHISNVFCGLVPGLTQVRRRDASILTGAKHPHMGVVRDNVITLECRRCSFFTSTPAQRLLAVIRKGQEVETKPKFTFWLFLGPYHTALTVTQSLLPLWNL